MSSIPLMQTLTGVCAFPGLRVQLVELPSLRAELMVTSWHHEQLGKSPFSKVAGVTHMTFQGKPKSGPLSNYSQHPSFLDTLFNFSPKRFWAGKV